MKFLPFAFLIALLSACSTSSRPLSGKITFGQVTRTSTHVELSAYLTNTSGRAVWFNSPLSLSQSSIHHYNLSMRTTDRSAWFDYDPVTQSGLLLSAKKLDDGKSAPFTVPVPLRERGHQFQVTVNIRDKPIYDPTAHTAAITSDPSRVP